MLVENRVMIGLTLGNRYRIESELREDAELVQYAGTDTRLHRPITIQVLRPDRARDDAYLRALETQTSRAAAVTHPAIVPVYDLALDHDPPYLITAATPGDSLADRLAVGQQFTPSEVEDIARQVARGLAAAHAAEIVHGALGPHNLLIDDQGTVSISGFGRPTEATPAVEQARYLAPEQAVGTAPTPASDVYALGATVYHLLVGQPPFDGPNAVAIGTLKNTGDPTPAADLVAGAELLCRTVDQALSRSPKARPADGSALLGAFESDPSAPAREAPAADLSATTVMPSLPPAGPAARPEPTRYAEPAPASPSPDRGVGAGGVLAVLVLCAIAGVIYWAVTHPQGDLPIPSLVGKTQTEAEQLLTGLGLKSQVIDQQHDESVPGGHILSQDPPPETKVLEGAAVQLVVSKGPRFVTVPNVTGIPAAQAAKLLSKSGLTHAGEVETQQEGYEAGIVTAQDPAAGRKVDKGAGVTLYVNAKSVPAEPAPGDQPSLLDQATEALKEKAGAALDQAAQDAKDKLRQGAEDLRDRAVETLKEKGQEAADALKDKVSGNGKPEEQPADPPAETPNP